LDDYRYTSDDTIVEGEIEEGKFMKKKTLTAPLKL
jgi:hypothetical protein